MSSWTVKAYQYENSKESLYSKMVLRKPCESCIDAGWSIGKIEISKTVNDVPSIMSKNIKIRIIFTKIWNNKVLEVSMTTVTNR